VATTPVAPALPPVELPVPLPIDVPPVEVPPIELPAVPALPTG
jgi:hypothetical protein